MTRALRTSAVLTVLAVAAAGCGSSNGSSSGAASQPATTAAKAKEEAAMKAKEEAAMKAKQSAGATVAVRTTRFGKILVNGKGRALYLFTHDRTRESRCSGACAKAWPPFITKASPKAAKGARASLLGTTRRSNGKLQVTYRGQPLYYYMGDRSPGEVGCQAVQAFGGFWYVVAPGGAAIR